MSDNGNKGNKNVQTQESPRRLRDERGYWLPGVSGNPTGGRQRKSIRTVLTDLDAQEAVFVLRSNLTCADPDIRLRTAAYILDQIFGKAKQTTELSGPDGGPIEISNARDEFERRIARIAEAGQPRSIPEAN